MARKKQILVIGFGKDHCTEVAYDAAYQVGLEIAKHGAILITGGLGGVMEAASRGAKDGGGFVIGIIPQDDKDMSNSYCDAVIATGIGFARDFVTAYSADAIIVIGGGAGTLIELSAAYQRKTPIVAVKGTGGVADRFVDEYIDDREMEKILGEDSPEKAVSKAISLTNLE
ncbi:MAG: TIGR00725 family protein [Candidatus Bathyarchaeia archaeon]